MTMAAATMRWTADMVRALPDDGNRYEVVDGELLVTPAPTWEHQAASRKLFLHLHGYLAAHALGEAILAPADVEFADDRMVEPDLFVVPLIDGRAPRTWEEAGCVILAVEILSPSTARADRLVKRRLYQRLRVPEYWIVDVDARLVERWRPDDQRPEMLAKHLAWRPDSAHPPLAIDLAAYFAEVRGE
ncbi:MAG TPA: Uma2 family endonuclease [Gemmatimonadaceae bacterium]|nr:Uma2 family endonuclease [Gemmatimonadaceae bacterium]